MLADATLEKSPDEDMLYDWDFSDESMFEDDPIASAAATQWDGTALSGITVGSPAISGTTVQTRIQGGTNSTTYSIKLKATSTAGYDRDAFLTLYVRRPS